MALHRWRNRARLFLGWMSYVSLLTPELVLAISLLSWYALLGLRLSLATVVIAHVSLTLPFVIMVIGARLDGLDPSLDDAARDLGATDWRILTRVTLPLLKPALVTGFLLAFLLSFDDFMVTFYTNGVGLDTLPVKLYGQMKLGLTPKLQALSTLMLFTSVVLVIVLVLRQKSSDELT
jgi:spermidine/putrescine transport system permease protein